MLVDSGSTATIINNNLSEQVITRLQLSSTETKLVGPNNADAEMIGETYVEIGISEKKFPTNIMVANVVIQSIIIEVRFIQR